MRICYQYRIRPNAAQESTLETWLELCRRQYNYRLAERFNWWEQNRSDLNRCLLAICYLPELKDKPDLYSQKRDLVNTKVLFPEYKDLPSHLLQDVLGRVDLAYQRWLKADSTGKRFGRPRFKGKGRYRSLTFPDPIKSSHVQPNRIQLPKLGWIKVIMHREIPEGFRIKTATISHKADGWYISLSLQDDSVPVVDPVADKVIGIDMGLHDFLITSEGEKVGIPQHYRKAHKRLKRLQKSVSRKKKGSNNRRKAIARLAKHHLHVVRQRQDFHHKTANQLINKGQGIA